MKKFLSIFVIMLLAFGFIACKKDNNKNKTDEPKETVVVINEENSKMSDLQFVEPKELEVANPVPKEGPVDLTAKVSFELSLTEKESTDKYSGSLELNFKANSLKFEKLEDLEADLVAKLLVKDGEEELLNAEVEAYLKAGVLYAAIPASLFGAEPEEGEPSFLTVSVDLNKILEMVMALLPAEGEAKEPELPNINLDDLSLKGLIKELVAMVPGLEEAGLNDQFIDKLIAFLKDLLPVLSYENKVFSLKIDATTIEGVLDKLAAFLKDNLDTINSLAAFIAEMSGETLADEDKLTNDMIDDLKPMILEEIKGLDLKNVLFKFYLNDHNKVNKAEANIDITVTNHDKDCDWVLGGDGNYSEVCDDVTNVYNVQANGALELATNKVSGSINLTANATSDGKDQGTYSYAASGSLEKDGKSLKGNYTASVTQGADELAKIELKAQLNEKDNGLDCSLEAKLNVEDNQALLKVNGELTNNGATSVSFDFDTTTAMDMTDTVIGLLGEALGGGSEDYPD